MQVDSLAVLEQRYQYKVAQGVMDIFPLLPFYALIVITSKTIIRLTEHQRVALENPHTLEIIHIKDNKHSLYLPPRGHAEFVNVVHYRPTPDLPQQIKQHETLQKPAYERPNRN